MGRLVDGLALRYPDIRVEVTTEDRAVDMIEEAYDLVIRVNPAPDESLVGHAFLNDRLVVVASPQFVRPPAEAPVPARSAARRVARPPGASLLPPRAEPPSRSIHFSAGLR